MILKNIVFVRRGTRYGTKLTMTSGTVWFIVSLTSVKFQKSFLVFLHTGHCVYSWSHVAGFSGVVTIQRSGFTPAVSEISRFCFLSDFEKNRSTTIYWWLWEFKGNATQRTTKPILTCLQYIRWPNTMCSACNLFSKMKLILRKSWISCAMSV